MDGCCEKKEEEVPRYRVALLGPYGTGNLGDAAIQEAIIQNLRRHLREVEFWGVSLRPADTMERHGIQAFPISRHVLDKHCNSQPQQTWRDINDSKKTAIHDQWPSIFANLARRMCDVLHEIRFMVKVFRFLKGIEVLIFSGGGQLDDYWGGAWAHPFTLLKWTLLARLAGAKVAFFGVGVDSLNLSMSKRFVRWALSLAQYKSYRDERSRSIAEQIGQHCKGFVHPDLAYGLDVSSLTENRVESENQELTIGVSPISASVWTNKESLQYQRYQQILVDFVAWLITENHRVCLFASQVKMDQPLIQQLIDDLKKKGISLDRLTVIPGDKLTLEELLSGVNQVDIVVASRLHGIILSSLLHKPLLALSYSEKVAIQMRDLGMDDYCIDLQCLALETVKERFIRLLSHRQAITRGLATQVQNNRSCLEFQYTQRLVPAIALQK